jgi:Flp pilus assembly protein TadG
MRHVGRGLAMAGRRAVQGHGAVDRVRRLARAAGRFAANRRGVTALEVALILPLFLFVIFGIVEVAMLYFVAAALEGQVGEASRQVRTGNVQASGDPLGSFRTLLCGPIAIVVDCARLIVDVRRYDSFAVVEYPEYIDEEGEPDDTQFLPGGAQDIVVVRVSYDWSILTPGLRLYLGDGGGPVKRLAATAVFRNEPFDT